MNKISSLLFLFFLFFCISNAKSQDQVSFGIEYQFYQLSWLIGDWERVGLEAGKYGGEQWIMKSDSLYEGVGYVVTEKDTSFIENLEIRKTQDGLFYIAEVPGNDKPVRFAIRVITDNHFICENNKHDYPKIIQYVREDKKLQVLIGDRSRTVEYWFKRSPLFDY